MATGQILAFTAAGAAKPLAEAIERHGQHHGTLHAIVVPWESEGDTVSMAVTSVRTDGWAIEHTNLGTITLTDLGSQLTRVVVIAHEPNHPEKEKLAGLLGGFAADIRSTFQAP